MNHSTYSVDDPDESSGEDTVDVSERPNFVPTPYRESGIVRRLECPECGQLLPIDPMTECDRCGAHIRLQLQVVAPALDTEK